MPKALFPNNAANIRNKATIKKSNVTSLRSYGALKRGFLSIISSFIKTIIKILDDNSITIKVKNLCTLLN
tara:strand:- start:486 stop:695 length:210 start_codon:yes stop_codon:yes gene_type:complete